MLSSLLLRLVHWDCLPYGLTVEKAALFLPCPPQSTLGKQLCRTKEGSIAKEYKRLEANVVFNFSWNSTVTFKQGVCLNSTGSICYKELTMGACHKDVLYLDSIRPVTEKQGFSSIHPPVYPRCSLQQRSSMWPPDPQFWKQKRWHLFYLSGQKMSCPPA